MTYRKDEKPAITVRRAAMNLLARREQTFVELVRKVTEKYPDIDADEVILPALERLREENLQSDERFAESFVRYRSSRGVGPLKIDMEMQQRGLAGALIQHALFNGDVDWVGICTDVAKKKFPEGIGESPQDKARCYRFLVQRGFSSDQIKEAALQ